MMLCRADFEELFPDIFSPAKVDPAQCEPLWPVPWCASARFAQTLSWRADHPLTFPTAQSR